MATRTLTGKINLVLAGHADTGSSFRSLDASYLPTWLSESRATMAKIQAAGIPVHLEPDPMTITSLVGNKDGLQFLKDSVTQGAIWDGHAHDNDLRGNAADVVDALLAAGVPFSGVLGSLTTGTEHTFASPLSGKAKVPHWFPILATPDAAGHTGSTTVTEGIIKTGATFNGVEQVEYLAGTADSVAKKSGLAKMLLSTQIKTVISVVRFNMLPTKLTDGSWSLSWVRPWHTGAPMPVPLMDDISHMMSDLGATASLVQWWDYASLVDQAKAEGLIGYTYTTTMS